MAKRKKERITNPIRNSKKSIIIEPKTDGQAIYLEAINNNPYVFCDGPAGSGKSFIALGSALQAHNDNSVSKIVIVRPTHLSSDEPELGFLPGTLDDKMEPFLAPLLKDSLPLLVNKNNIYNYDGVSSLLKKFNIEIVPLQFMRGRTFHHSFVILDEAQNCSMKDFKLFLTRIGQKSRVVIEGDSTQTDNNSNCLQVLMRQLEPLPFVENVLLNGSDIVRNRYTQEILERLKV